MTIQEALLAAIIATPDDDLPRLVYADWLEENGQGERADFIRAQLSSPDVSFTRETRYWQPDADPSRDAAAGTYTERFVRGFVVEYRGQLDRWMQVGPEMVRQHPVEYVRLVDVFPGVVTSGGPRGNFIRFNRPLPQQIMDELNKIWESSVNTTEAATERLSVAAINWAKSQ